MKKQYLRIYFSSPKPIAHVYVYSIDRHPPSVVHSSSVHRQHFQTPAPQKQLGQSKPNSMWSLHGSGELRGSWELTGPVEAKFDVEPPLVGRTKVPSNGHGHMTNIGTMPIYGKNRRFQNQTTDDLETWYATLGAHVLSNFFRRWPWIDLWPFYWKVKFTPIVHL